MRSTYQSIFAIGVLLCLLYLKLIPHVHNYPHAGKEFYVGAKLLALGRNPYNNQQLQDASRRYASEGQVAGKKEQPQIHLPATLAVIGLFTHLPWPVFCALQVVFNVFCIPAIVYLCLRYLYARPPLAGLWAASLGMAFIAPTWQNVVIAQVALPMTLFFLLLARVFTRRSSAFLGAFSFLALLKFTFSVLLLAYIFWKATSPQRLALMLAAIAFLALNAIEIARIGPHAFWSGYQQQVSYSFALGGLNDPSGPGRSARVDLAVLFSGLKQPTVMNLLTRALQVGLVGLFLLRAVRSGWLQERHLGLMEVSALALLTLLLFYHRAYDTVMLIPALGVVVFAWKERRLRPVHWALAATVTLCLAAVGNHNLVDFLLSRVGMTQPPFLRVLTVLVSYLLLIVATPEGDTSPAETIAPTSNPLDTATKLVCSCIA